MTHSSDMTTSRPNSMSFTSILTFLFIFAEFALCSLTLLTTHQQRVPSKDALIAFNALVYLAGQSAHISALKACKGLMLLFRRYKTIWQYFFATFVTAVKPAWEKLKWLSSCLLVGGARYSGGKEDTHSRSGAGRKIRFR